MTQACDKEKFWLPDRNWNHDLLNTGQALYPLIELRELMESMVI